MRCVDAGSPGEGWPSPGLQGTTGSVGVFHGGDEHDAFYTPGSLYATATISLERLEQIAAAAKFTKGAIYYYFKSKERLLLQILDDIEAARARGDLVRAARLRSGISNSPPTARR